MAYNYIDMYFVLCYIDFNSILYKGEYAMTEYCLGTASEKDEIIDFINYVFSQAKFPHDFRVLTPKSYGDNAKELGAVHYLAKCDGKIKALVATRIIDVNVGGKTLRYGLIGNVSVHPYSRGEGHMKHLMAMAKDDAKERGVDVLVLGGQRQRYGYFGYELGGTVYSYTVTKTNLRHCLGDTDTSCVTFATLEEKDVFFAKSLYERNVFHAIRPEDEFVDIVHTWNKQCRMIYKDNVPVGYVYGNFEEVVLEDEKDYPLVLKAFFEEEALSEINIRIAPWQKERKDFLMNLCEGCSVQHVEMLNVLNWEKVLDAFFSFKSRCFSLEDGKQNLRIDGEAFELKVSGGAASVTKTDKCDGQTHELDHMQAQRLIFSLATVMNPDENRLNWFPLHFYLDSPDGY